MSGESLGNWTEARVERLKAMWADGMSASVIATALGGVSRNSVIGKISRLGLRRDESAVHGARMAMRPKKYARTSPPRDPAQPKASRKPRYDGFAAINAKRRAERPGPGLPPDPQPRVIDMTHAKPWLERAFGECAYPISGEGADTWSCCAHTDRTYCPAHEAVMYSERQPTMKKTMRLSRLAA